MPTEDTNQCTDLLRRPGKILRTHHTNAVDHYTDKEPSMKLDNDWMFSGCDVLWREDVDFDVLVVDHLICQP